MTREHHGSEAAKVDQVALEPDRLYMFRSTLAGRGAYSQSFAYFLVRSGGNCLVHGPDSPEFYRSHRRFFDEHGGIALQLCSHGGDVPDATPLIEKIWGARLYLSRWDVEPVARKLARSIEGFAEGVGPGRDLRAIHTPAHTVGFHCFRWKGERGRYLFASHLIVPQTGGWGFTFHPPAMRPAALRSLELLRTLDVDWLLPNRIRRRGNPASGPAVPLAFGKSEREQAVTQALAVLARKDRAAARRAAP